MVAEPDTTPEAALRIPERDVAKVVVPVMFRAPPKVTAPELPVAAVIPFIVVFPSVAIATVGVFPFVTVITVSYAEASTS